MDVFFSLIAGVCWIIVYIQLIRLGFRDKTYGMPVFPLALNVTWEAIYSLISLKNNPVGPQGIVILIWFLLDTVIVYTYLKYGRKYFPVNKKYFLPWTIVIFIMAFALQFSFIAEFASLAITYSAFIMNLIMSVAFIYMLYDRKSTEGQSISVAVLKWIGTLAATIVFGVINFNQLVLVLGIFSAIFDVIYLFCLRSALKTPFNRSKACLNSRRSHADLH